MNLVSRTRRIQLAMRVNGVEFDEVRLRQASAHTSGLEVVLEHPALGPFALHDGFELEVKQSGGGEWQRVSLTQVKALVRTAVETRMNADHLSPVHEGQSNGLLCGSSDFENTKPLPPVVPDEDRCIHHVEGVLERAGIAYWAVGTMFVVSKLLKARIWLRRAGFEQSSLSKAILIEPQSGCAIELFEHQPGTLDINENDDLPGV